MRALPHKHRVWAVLFPQLLLAVARFVVFSIVDVSGLRKNTIASRKNPMAVSSRSVLSLFLACLFTLTRLSFPVPPLPYPFTLPIHSSAVALHHLLFWERESYCRE